MKHYLFFLSLVACMFVSHAQTITPSGHTLYFMDTYGGAWIQYDSSYRSISGTLIIPDSILVYNAVSGGYSNIPVIKIDDNAFRECTEINSVVIPNTVTTIGAQAFYECTGLETINLSNNLVSLGGNAFLHCENLFSVNLPNSLTELGWDVFRGTAIRSISIPEGISTIPVGAFSDCRRLDSITIPASITRIEGSAFSESVVKYVNFLGTVEQWNAIDIHEPLYIMYSHQPRFGMANPIRNAKRLFINGELLTSLTFSDTVTRVGNNFRYDTALISIALHNGITSILPWAFSGCYGLERISLGNGIDSLKTGSFSGCSRLSQVNIPSSVVYIGDSVFYGTCCRFCMQSEEPPALGTNTFAKRNSYYSSESSCTEKIIVPCGAYNRYHSAWRHGLRGRLQEGTLADAVVVSNNTQWGGASKVADAGCAIIVQATPLQHYVFSHWSTGSTSARDTIRQSDSDTIVAYFTPATYSITGVANNSDRGSVQGGGSAYYLDTVALIAVPNYGYKFTRWNDYSTANPKYISVSGNKTMTAYFDYEQFTITVGVDSSIHGSVTGSGTFDYLSTRTIIATPNYGYHFVRWSDGNTTIQRTITLTHDISLVAIFAKNQYSIVGFSNNVLCGRVLGSDTVDYLEDVILTAVPNYGYHFMQWNDGNTDNPRQITATHDKVFTAQFNKNQYAISLIANIESYGTVSGAGTFDYLTNVSINALSNVGYHFVHWSDGNTNNPRTLCLTRDTSLTAVFAPNLYRVLGVSSNDALGCVEGSDTVEYLSTVILTAVPNYGFHFARWNDSNTNNPRLISVTGNSVYQAYFDTNQYSLIVNTTNASQGTVNGSGSYNFLTQNTIQATANTGYHFTQWSDGNTDNPRVVVLTRDTSFIAQFAPNQYTLAGSVNYSERGTVEGVGAYNYLDTATLMAVPNHGYRFSRWGDNNYDNPRQVVVTQDKSYTAYFDYDQFSITLSVDDPAHGSVSGEGTYNYLANRTVRATENSGYYFAHWSDGSTANPYTFTLTSDTSLTAHYYALQVDSEDASKGSVSQTREGYCSAHIQATARTGYHFLQWSDGSTQNPRTVTLTQDTMITAYFAPNQYTLILRSSDVSLGSVSGGGTFDYGTEITISATVTAAHYHFAGWSDYSTENPRQYTILRDATLTAYFEIDRHTVAVQSSDITMGQVEGGGVFAYGQPCTVSATPYSGYEFVNWSDGSPYNPYTFAVQRDMVLTANFAPVGTHTYTITAVSDNTAMGTVSGGGTFASGTVATLTAIPAAGYQFDRWQDGNRDNPRTVTVTGNATYTAYFVETVGVEDVVDGEGVRVWSYDGRIHVVGAEGMDVNVYDMLGRRVSGKRKVESGKLELAVPAGVYLVRIGDLPARKVVVIKR